MAKLSDEQWDMIQDSIKKKRIASSGRNQRTHCGKRGRVNLPSDYMTKKEIKAMNGELIIYRMNDPMSWEEFKKLPDDLKVQYIKTLREKFRIPDKVLAEAMHTNKVVFGRWIRTLGLGQGKGAGTANRNWDESKCHDEFVKWWYGEDTDDVTAKDNQADISQTQITEPSAEQGANVEELTAESTCVIPASGSLVLECKANEALKTISRILCDSKVHLNISWEVIKNSTTKGD